MRCSNICFSLVRVDEWMERKQRVKWEKFKEIFILFSREESTNGKMSERKKETLFSPCFCWCSEPGSGFGRRLLLSHNRPSLDVQYVGECVSVWYHLWAGTLCEEHDWFIFKNRLNKSHQTHQHQLPRCAQFFDDCLCHRYYNSYTLCGPWAQRTQNTHHRIWLISHKTHCLKIQQCCFFW